MSSRLIKIGLINQAGDQALQPKEFYSYSLKDRLRGWLLFVKKHSAWPLQFITEIISGKSKINNIDADHIPVNEKPLVYSCLGCSSAAQMANYLAIQMDRDGVAEMSCIGGVGGNVKKLVLTATSGKNIIVIDGCPLACAKACFANHNVTPDLHVELTSLGVRKKQHENFDMQQAREISKLIRKKIPFQMKQSV